MRVVGGWVRCGWVVTRSNSSLSYHQSIQQWRTFLYLVLVGLCMCARPRRQRRACGSPCSRFTARPPGTLRAASYSSRCGLGAR